jgi:hypothetical protein
MDFFQPILHNIAISRFTVVLTFAMHLEQNRKNKNLKIILSYIIRITLSKNYGNKNGRSKTMIQNWSPFVEA